MNRIDVWAVLGGSEPRPRSVARVANNLMRRTLRRIPVVELLPNHQLTGRAVDCIAGPPPRERKTPPQRLLLPADVLAHVAYTVEADLDAEAFLAPWLTASMSFEDFEFVVRHSSAGSVDPFAIRDGCALLLSCANGSFSKDMTSTAFDGVDSCMTCSGVTA